MRFVEWQEETTSIADTTVSARVIPAIPIHIELSELTPGQTRWWCISTTGEHRRGVTRAAVSRDGWKDTYENCVAKLRTVCVSWCRRGYDSVRLRDIGFRRQPSDERRHDD